MISGNTLPVPDASRSAADAVPVLLYYYERMRFGLIVALVLVGCGGDPAPDGGTEADAGAEADAGVNSSQAAPQHLGLSAGSGSMEGSGTHLDLRASVPTPGVEMMGESTRLRLRRVR